MFEPPDQPAAKTRQALNRLLIDLFDPSQLRQWLSLHGYREVLPSLPAGNASMEDLTAKTVEQLERRGLISEPLFEGLQTERPARAIDIERVARAWSAMKPAERRTSVRPGEATAWESSLIIPFAFSFAFSMMLAALLACYIPLTAAVFIVVAVFLVLTSVLLLYTKRVREGAVAGGLSVFAIDRATAVALAGGLATGAPLGGFLGEALGESSSQSTGLPRLGRTSKQVSPDAREGNLASSNALHVSKVWSKRKPTVDRPWPTSQDVEQNTTRDLSCVVVSDDSHDVCVNSTPVTVSEYWECVDSGDCASPYIVREGCSSQFADGSQKPITCVDRFDAGKYCKRSGSRLPRLDEWSRARRIGGKKWLETPFEWTTDTVAVQDGVDPGNSIAHLNRNHRNPLMGNCEACHPDIPSRVFDDFFSAYERVSFRCVKTMTE